MPFQIPALFLTSSSQPTGRMLFAHTFLVSTFTSQDPAPINTFECLQTTCLLHLFLLLGESIKHRNTSSFFQTNNINKINKISKHLTMVLRKCITELDSINLSSDLVTAFISISRKLVISYFRENTDAFRAP